MSDPPSAKVKTRILIISDTHGVKPWFKAGLADTEDELDQEDLRFMNTGYREPLAEADVVLHCGDLTKRTRVEEYENTFSTLRAIRAPLKLAIAGNHDIVLDEPYWLHKWGGTPDAVPRVRSIIEDAKADGVHYLTEGVHEFDLANGARLRVYASPYTPAYGGWAFQYHNGHDFDIPSDVDVAMTHGPPRGILDLARMSRTHAGCEDLFEAIHRARPKIHCFGHIHEGWGAQLARWKDGDDGPVRAPSVIDERESTQITLSEIQPDKLPGDEEGRRMRQRLVEMSKQRGIFMDLTQGKQKLVEGEQTLFVNAAIMNIRYRPAQMPWLVDVDLARRGSR